MGPGKQHWLRLEPARREGDSNAPRKRVESPTLNSAYRIQALSGNQGMGALVQRKYVQRHHSSEDPALTSIAAIARKSAEQAVEQRASLLDDVDKTAEDVLEWALNRRRVPIQRAVGIEKGIKNYAKAVTKGLGKQQSLRRNDVKNLLETQVETLLTKHKVPPPKRFDVVALRDANGKFHPGDWLVEIGEARLPDPSSPDEAKYAATTAFHEARHVEQWFSIARCAGLLMTKKEQPSDLFYNLKMLVPIEILNLAINAGQFDKESKRKWARGMLSANLPGEYPSLEIHRDIVDYKAHQDRSRKWLDSVNRDIRTFEAYQQDPSTDKLPFSVDHWQLSEGKKRVKEVWEKLEGGGATKTRRRGIDISSLQEATNKYLEVYQQELVAESTAAVEYHKAGLEKYRNLPDESDALRVQDLVREQLELKPE